MVASHAKKAEVYANVSTEDVPSAAWGWSALSRRAVATAGICGGLFLLGMLFGNHKGHVEDIWLIVSAVLTFIGTAFVTLQPKLTQVRTVTAHNKAEGHVEPVWTEDQLHGTGVYANLSREERLALNTDGTSAGTEIDGTTADPELAH
ncbi:DUF2631 domain-containing protein [Corynebacterium anserum]|uniref:DUF2631 domain-containing protein n=1 Tax=Corynebacterium anserum TaxID=2684406 RepID=UPI001C8F1191|nr:DUF2631 domain-containing protein [Corynebacterium anserum]